jgi:hypothetical protein
MAAIFTLLVANTLTYLAAGTPSEALDSIAWLILLALFELETGHAARLGDPRATAAVRAVRILAAVALIAALAGYVHGNEWLDALNVGLWIAVVALLELEVRRPEAVTRHRAMFSATALVLYAGLSALVAAWLWRGDWFDAYDAALWLVAFATLEMDVLGLAPSSGGERPG